MTDPAQTARALAAGALIAGAGFALDALLLRGGDLERASWGLLAVPVAWFVYRRALPSSDEAARTGGRGSFQLGGE